LNFTQNLSIVKNFSNKSAALAIALACNGCLTIPIPIPTPIPVETSPSPSPGQTKEDDPLQKTQQVLQEKYKKTCYADALTENEGKKITQDSGELEIAADKLAGAGKHKDAIRKYNEAGAAALNETIAGGTAEDMENYNGDVEGFREENRSLIQKSAELNFKIGQSYIQLGKAESAIDCFDGTLKIGILPPNDAIAHLNRGDAYERIGNKTKAKADFQQAINLFKKYKEPTYQKISEQRLQAVSN
jgi:tetratricopeptide (TPR) repeat protein